MCENKENEFVKFEDLFGDYLEESLDGLTIKGNHIYKSYYFDVDVLFDEIIRDLYRWIGTNEKIIDRKSAILEMADFNIYIRYGGRKEIVEKIDDRLFLTSFWYENENETHIMPFITDHYDIEIKVNKDISKNGKDKVHIIRPNLEVMWAIKLSLNNEIKLYRTGK